MSSNVINLMEHKWNVNLLIEDLTDEFYEPVTSAFNLILLI